LPEILLFEKRQGRKYCGTGKIIYSLQELDFFKTRVFSYNFYLSKIGCMYNKTIDQIQIFLQEYLEEKKISREAALLVRDLDIDLSEVSVENGTESDCSSTSLSF
jgi:hypothetical protein